MTLKQWIEQERDKILRNTELTQIAAVRQLYGLGYSVEAAWEMTSQKGGSKK